MAEKRVDLEGTLAGSHVLVNPDGFTLGFLEDLQSQEASLILNALAGVIVGGDLPTGTERTGLRKLTMAQLEPLLTGVLSAFAEIPKRGAERVRQVVRGDAE